MFTVNYCFTIIFVLFSFSISLIDGYYTYTSGTNSNCTVYGTLTYNSQQPNPYPEYGSPISPLDICIILHTSGSIRLRIIDSNNPRWEINNYDTTFIPNPYLPCNNTPYNYCPPININITEAPLPFQYTITSLETNQIIIQSTTNIFYYYDQYLSVQYTLPPSIIYGLGERISNTLRLAPANYTIFTLDQGDPGSFAWPELNYYGAHPMFISVQPNSTVNSSSRHISSYGTYFHNPHAMQISLQYDNTTTIPTTPVNITYTTIGGIMDMFYFIAYPFSIPVVPMEQVIQQYQYVLGSPALIPYYELGFHQCRYGYQTINETIEAHDLLYNASIPFETIWNDIDHMNQTRDFTLDPIRFPKDQVDTFVEQLHAEGHRYILILDPAINIASNYPPWERGLAMNAYILNSQGTEPFLGVLWAAGLSMWPDFTNPNTTIWWNNEISIFHGTTGPLFDGLWIDTNEPQNVCNTPNQPTICPNGTSIYYNLEELVHKGIMDINTKLYIEQYRNHYQHITKNSIAQYSDSFDPENPPWAPITYHGTNRNPSEGTINASSIQYAGLHYSVHSLYGYSEAKATYEALQTIFPTYRPFVLSRSLFSAASARYAVHWTGDNIAEFSALQQSLPEVMTLTLEGMPFTGADTGGFIGNATEELIIRWMQTAALGYGFHRAHHIPSGNDNNPGAWSKNASAIMNQAIRTRYSIIPYMYTISYKVSQGCVLSETTYGCSSWFANGGGGGLIRPLVYEYPNDMNTYNLTSQNMIGSALLASPALYEGQTMVTAYFPLQDIWYDYFTGIPIITNQSGYSTINTPITNFNLHIRGGHTLPLQIPNSTDMNVYQSRQQPFTLLITMDKDNQYSIGELYWDDGITFNPSTFDQTLFMFETIINTTNLPKPMITIHSKIMNNNIGPSALDLTFQSVIMYGVPSIFSSISIIKFNNNPCTGTDYMYNTTNQVLTMNVPNTCNNNNKIVFSQDWTLTMA